MGDTSLSVAPHMRCQFDVGEGEFCTILIGKDGTLKLRSTVLVSVSDIFGLIDTMPMRQEEMSRKKASVKCYH